MCPLPARVNYANYVYQLLTEYLLLSWMVYLASYSRSVVNLFCVLSQSLFCLFVCLFVSIYTVSEKVLKVHFWRRFSKVVFSTGNTMELVECLSLLKRPKTDNFGKYKIRLPWIPYSAEELYFRQQFSELHRHYTAENFSKNRKQQLKGGTHIKLAWEKGLLVELNCHWCTVQLVRPVTIPRATTERCMPGNAVIMLFFQVKIINLSPKNKPCRFFFLFLKMPKTWVCRTTLNEEKKGDGLLI